MKYVTVRDYLVELIDTRLSVGDVVPSERELAERFGVSRMTVRQAVDSLVSSGRLERRRGSGTYVRAPKVDVQSRISSFSEEMRQRGMIPDTRVLRGEELPATPDVAVWLGIEPGESVHFIYRVRLADGIPMAVERTWISTRVMPDLLANGVPTSIYGALADAGLVPTWGEDAIEALSGDAVICELLHIPVGSPLLAINRRTYADDLAVSYSGSWYRGDRYKLWVPISGPRRTLYPPRGGSR
ncbi:GntR family transcriptional regulator [Cutibacterium avidum]|uniref:GntR family transcriptional regulator n=1 Tax=Cutibacterium avidum TaxID=33010 RepID=UPI000BFB5BF8|nr:GntR family transcriptional regulator [Cutibacterium avidum]MCO6672098.1 GntR family transcriptional regulator [Cutibacterium avidum]PGX68451.1 GntR family transcriptional regulator [Cutibacterium avidum]PGX69094.1 GntR family transcriptional regulator [Cutibacterium avidum]